MKKRFTALLLTLLLLFPFAASADPEQVPFDPALVVAESLAQDEWLADSASRARFSVLIYTDYVNSLEDPDRPPIEAELPGSDSFVGKFNELIVLMVVGGDGRAIYLMYDTQGRRASWLIMPERTSAQHLEIFTDACSGDCWENEPEQLKAAAGVKEAPSGTDGGEGTASGDGGVTGTVPAVTEEPAEAPSAVGTWTCGRIATLEIHGGGKARMRLVDGGHIDFDWVQEGDVLTLSQPGATPVTGVVTEHSLTIQLISTTMDFTR